MSTTETEAAADMVFGWDSTQVLCTINMSEGFTLAALFDALGRPDAAAHVIREVWEGESDGDRDPLPWEHHTDGTRLPFLGSSAPTPDYLFSPRLSWDDGTWYCDLCSAPASAAGLTCPRCGIGETTGTSA